MSATVHRIDVRGSELAVHDSGGPGDAIVLAHGVGSSARFLVDAFRGPLRRAGLRLVAFDLRGHGGSAPAVSPRDHHLATHAADLAVVADRFAARIVGGVSLGAHAAVAAAGSGRWGTVLACLPAWTGRAVPGEGTHAAVAEAVRSEGVRNLIAGFERDETLPVWLRTVLVRDWRAADPASLAAALQALDGGLAPTEADLRALPAGLAVVGWPEDPGHPLTVAREWASWAPRSGLATLEMSALDRDLASLGRAAVAALAAVGAVRTVS